MWKLNELYAENICAFSELHYVLHQGVTTLGFGNNMDNESQRSNGSGKSALIESIAVGITGSPLRKVKRRDYQRCGRRVQDSFAVLQRCIYRSFCHQP